MKCVSCGKDNPAGARYCVHCGVEQAVPTPIAAVAAASMATRARNTVPQAANAAQADPAPDDRAQVATKREPAPWIGARDEPAARDDPPLPAYASSPGRVGLAAVIIAACIGGAAIAFFAWWMYGGNGVTTATWGVGESSVMAAYPPDATPGNPRRAAAPSAQADAGTSERTPATVASPAAAPAALPDASAPAQAAAPAPPVEIKPLPAKPAPRAAVRRPPAEKPAPPPVHAPAEPAPPPARPPVVAAAPKAAPVVDRWTRMSDELSRCTREDFIARVICDQRVRFRYCSGYWGKVAQCPGNPAADHGQ